MALHMPHAEHGTCMPRSHKWGVFLIPHEWGKETAGIVFASPCIRARRVPGTVISPPPVTRFFTCRSGKTAVQHAARGPPRFIAASGSRVCVISLHSSDTHICARFPPDHGTLTPDSAGWCLALTQPLPGRELLSLIPQGLAYTVRMTERQSYNRSASGCMPQSAQPSQRRQRIMHAPLPLATSPTTARLSHSSRHCVGRMSDSWFVIW